MKSLRLLLLTLTLLVVNLMSTAQINVGVFLPFKAGGTTGLSAVEYYRGLLMAIDSLSHDGTKFNVVAADCGTTPANMKALLDESRNGVFDIIFAPSNLNQAQVVNEYSRLNGTKFTMIFGGRYDELITNPNYYALKVTQTDYTPRACRLLQSVFKGKDIYVVSANGGKETCPFANYLIKYVKGTKSLDLNQKEKKVIQALADPNAVVVPSTYDEQAQKAIMHLAAMTPGLKAAIIGYPAWYDRAKTTADNIALGKINAYLIQTHYPRMSLPRIKKFLEQYQHNFGIKLPDTGFSTPMWGFDTGYYLLKGLVRHKRDFYNQPLYSAPLQNAFRFEPRSTKQGLINTHVLILHYKAASPPKPRLANAATISASAAISAWP